MERLGIVTAGLGAVYILGRGPFLVAPTETVAFYRRAFSTPARLRIFGTLMAALAATLIVTVNRASVVHEGVAGLIWLIGWLAAFASAWVLLAPRQVMRLQESTLFSASEPVLRMIGAANVAWGLALVWIAFFVL